MTNLINLINFVDFRGVSVRFYSRSAFLARVALGATALLAAACGDAGSPTSPGVAVGADGVSESTPSAAHGMADVALTRENGTAVRLGYLPNLTHGSAIVGIETGIFADKLGPDQLKVKRFNAGPDVVMAIFSGAIDIAYLGPNPSINAFVKSEGEAVRIVSGAAAGGVALVVEPDITTPGQLRGKRIATPQLGGTQDVAARSWLRSQGLKTNLQGGGDVAVIPQENAQTLEAFKAGRIDGAWVPEPWASRLVQEGGGQVLVDEADLWPGGQFVTTNVVVSKSFMEDHPESLRRFLEGHVAANRFIAANPNTAKKIVNDAITRYTGKRLAPAIIDAAWPRISFTNDPVADSLFASAAAAEAEGFLESSQLEGIYELSSLNQVLAAYGLTKVEA